MWKIPKSEVFCECKVIVLMNKETASNAEYTEYYGYKKSNRWCRQEYVANYPSLWINYLYFWNGLYYPDGKETQRIGIVPDINMKPALKGIKEGRDVLLERAVRIIKIDVLKH